MRLVSLELSGFRGFPRRQEFDLDGDAIVVVGANGHGKTSLFDGILWALSGRVPRLHEQGSLLSLFSESGHTKARLTLRGAHSAATVTRSFDGESARLTLDSNGKVLSGPAAEGALIDLICPSVASASNPSDVLAGMLTCSLYLQQDLVRHFVEAATVQDRFAAVGELVGAGRVAQLQAALERSKRAWSAATNQRSDDLRPTRERLTLIEARLGELARTPSRPPLTAERWEAWWKSLAQFSVSLAPPRHTSSEAPTAIDSALKELASKRHSYERMLRNLEMVAVDISQYLQLSIPDVEELNSKLEESVKQRDALKRSIETESARLAELRRLQLQVSEANAQLRTLAALALRHLHDRCPVCDQSYDKEKTTSRLQSLVGNTEPFALQGDSQALDKLSVELAEVEKFVTDLQLAIGSATQLSSQRRVLERSIESQLREVGLRTSEGTTVSTEGLNERLSRTRAMLELSLKVEREGESLALELAHYSAAAMVDELRTEAEALRRKCDEEVNAIASRNTTGEQAQTIIEALRQASLDVVEERLSEINSLLQSIYTRIDPHPAFRLVRFLSSISRGKGQLATLVSDPVTEKQSANPAAVLSSSQLNALAVSIFFALNIGAPLASLPLAILDDPMQSMDDINLLGLVDLLRRLKSQRQLLVSTHDSRFGELLSRKLRPTGQQGRTIVVDLHGWSRKGPTVTYRDVPADAAKLRLVAAA